MTGKTKVFVGIGAVVLLGSIALFSLRGSGNRGAEVRLEGVGVRNLKATVTASGNLRARRQVDMSSEVSARVSQMLVDEGDDVTAGDVLLRLDRTQIEAVRSRAAASVSQAQAQAATARANFVRSERDFERIDGLWQRDTLLISRQQLEQAEADLEVARANLEAAEYGVEVATATLDEQNDRLSRTVFTAPIDGRVIRLNVEEGETVIVGTMNNPGSLILSIADLSVVEVVVQVDETDVPRLSIGDSAQVTIDAFPNRSFTARVTEIANSAIQDPSTTAGSGQQAAIDFEVVLTLDPTDADLRPDLSATAEIITDTRDDVLSIPIIALTVRDDTTSTSPDAADGAPADIEGVFVVENGLVRFRPVQVGIAGRDYFEVLSGLEVGDTVVAGPYQTIRTLNDGDAVRATPASGSGGTASAAPSN